MVDDVEVRIVIVVIIAIGGLVGIQVIGRERS